MKYENIVSMFVDLYLHRGMNYSKEAVDRALSAGLQHLVYERLFPKQKEVVELFVRCRCLCLPSHWQWKIPLL